MTYVNEGGANKRDAEKGGQGTLLNRMTTPSPDMELPQGVKTTGDVMRELGYAIVAGTPAEFADFIRTDIEKWRRIVQDKNLSAE
jgi:hypothetical protein